MSFKINGKKYNVEEVIYDGAIVNVNGTSITDLDKMAKITKTKGYKKTGHYTVLCNGSELVFYTFDDAYNFAKKDQQDTIRIEHNW